MKFNLLTASALRAFSASAASQPDEDDTDAGPAPAEPDQGGDAAPESQPDDGGETTTDKPDKGQATTDVVAAADAASEINASYAKGFAAANARMNTVLTSPEGSKNPALAAFLLSNSNASADAIIGQLKSQPGASAPTGQEIPDTNVDLGSGVDPKAIAEDGSKKDDGDGWGDAINTTAGTLGYGGAVTAGGNAALRPAQAQNPTGPACPPTGN